MEQLNKNPENKSTQNAENNNWQSIESQERDRKSLIESVKEKFSAHKKTIRRAVTCLVLAACTAGMLSSIKKNLDTTNNPKAAQEFLTSVEAIKSINAGGSAINDFAIETPKIPEPTKDALKSTLSSFLQPKESAPKATLKSIKKIGLGGNPNDQHIVEGDSSTKQQPKDFVEEDYSSAEQEQNSKESIEKESSTAEQGQDDISEIDRIAAIRGHEMGLTQADFEKNNKILFEGPSNQNDPLGEEPKKETSEQTGKFIQEVQVNGEPITDANGNLLSSADKHQKDLEELFEGMSPDERRAASMWTMPPDNSKEEEQKIKEEIEKTEEALKKAQEEFKAKETAEQSVEKDLRAKETAEQTIEDTNKELTDIGEDSLTDTTDVEITSIGEPPLPPTELAPKTEYDGKNMTELRLANDEKISQIASELDLEKSDDVLTKLENCIKTVFYISESGHTNTDIEPALRFEDSFYPKENKSDLALYHDLFEGASTCASNAVKLQRILNEANINSLCVVMGNSEGEARHVANLVELGDSYYYIDATMAQEIFQAPGAQKFQAAVGLGKDYERFFTPISAVDIDGNAVDVPENISEERFQFAIVDAIANESYDKWAAEKRNNSNN